MSSYVMHMCISNVIKEKLKLTDKFIYGSILPDIIKNITGDRRKTHYLETVVIDRETKNLPHIDRAIKELNIQDKEIRLGYIAHLIEDLIWFRDYVPTYAKEVSPNEIYYLCDGKIHDAKEFTQDMYLDYYNSSAYVENICNTNMEMLKESLSNIIEDEEHIKKMLENTRYFEGADIKANKFMTKHSIDKYIKQSAEEVEKIVLELIGE